jgi:hypothetical protein
MATFGEIKTKIDETFINLYGKDEFKFFSNQFKKIVLENKDIAELYYIYNDLTENKGIPVDLVNDYINESVEYSQILVENNNKELSRINSWINSIDLHGDVKNIYETIDSVIYNNSIKNLENILESKKQISKNISTPKKEVSIKESINLPLSGIFGKFRRLNEKARENIIAKRLEERFTKEEIITMYLNQFDFLYNAVGIENASKVYFNKKPGQLTKTEAATLVGMCKNPDLYNPYKYKIKN